MACRLRASGVVMDSLPWFVLLVALALPAVLVRAVRGTRLFWLPGTVVLLGAVALFIAGITVHPDSEDVGGALAACFAVIGSGILLVYGLCLVLAARAPKPPSIPEATVVRDIRTCD